MITAGAIAYVAAALIICRATALDLLDLLKAHAAAPELRLPRASSRSTSSARSTAITRSSSSESVPSAASAAASISTSGSSPG